LKPTISILGCGWLGQPLAKHLLTKGYSIKGSTTSKGKMDQLGSSGISPFLIELESLNSNISEFLEAEILIVNIPSKNSKSFENLIVEIEKSSVKKVLFISSTSVYEPSAEMITENSALMTSNLVNIENLFLRNSYFSTTIIRFAGLMGYMRNPGRFFPAGKSIKNPDGFVNMIHRDDCIAIITDIIERGIWNETFNACSDQHPTRREFYSKAALEIGLPIPHFIENSPNSFKIISNKKIKSYLNYTFIYPDIMNALQGEN
jgi:nucleoside-diphosphate-sugar epimerase